MWLEDSRCQRLVQIHLALYPPRIGSPARPTSQRLQLAARPTLQPAQLAVLPTLVLEYPVVRPMVLRASRSAALFGLAHPTVKGSLLE